MKTIRQPQLYPVIPGVTSRVMNSFWCRDETALRRLTVYLEELGYEIRDERRKGSSESELVRRDEPLWTARLKPRWARCNNCLAMHHINDAHRHGVLCQCGSVLYRQIVRGSVITFSFFGDSTDTHIMMRVLSWSHRAGLLLLEPHVLKADYQDVLNIESGEACLKAHQDLWSTVPYGRETAISLRYAAGDSGWRNAIKIHHIAGDEVNFTEIWVVAGREYVPDDPELPLPMHIGIREDWDHSAPADRHIERKAVRR